MLTVPPANAEHFVPYGPSHWIALALIALASAGFALLLRWGGWHDAMRARRLVCWPLAGLLLGGVVVAQAQRVVAGEWSLQESLPLHLCDISVLICGAALIGAGWMQPPPRWTQRLYEPAYIWGVGGTTQSLLTPDNPAPFPEIACIRYFVLHGAIIVTISVLTFGVRMRPQPGTVRRVWLTTFCLAVAVLGVNALLGSNYMYLCGPPKHPSLFDLFGQWPWSLGPLVIVATLLITLCYLPFYLQDRWRAPRRAAATDSLPATR